MRRSLIICCFIAISYAANCQTKINVALQKQIQAMFKDDQKWRIESSNINTGKPSVYNDETVERNMGKADSANLVAAKLIIQQYGFPGYKLVDTSDSDGFWAVVQHCDQDLAFQQRVLLLMGKEVQRHNATGENYAFLQDRVLISLGRKQIYGTQVRMDLKTHIAKPLPIQDSTHVDIRRKSVGLMPLNDYLKLFNRQ